MQVTVNGFSEEMPDGTTIAEVIDGNQEFEVHMIVELNHRFIHQKDFASTVLKEGDLLELIHPAFGG